VPAGFGTDAVRSIAQVRRLSGAALPMRSSECVFMTPSAPSTPIKVGNPWARFVGADAEVLLSIEAKPWWISLAGGCGSSSGFSGRR